MAYRAGTAFIAITPSFRGFQTKIEAHSKTIPPVHVKVEYDYPTKPITPPPIKNPRITPHVNTKPAFAKLAALEARLDKLSRGRTLINLAIMAAPLAVPALAAGAGGLAAAGSILGAGALGAGAFAGLGMAALSPVNEAREKTSDIAAKQAKLKAAPLTATTKKGRAKQQGAKDLKLDTLESARKNALGSLSGPQKEAAASIDQLSSSWRGFMKTISTPVLGALVKGMEALTKTFEPLGTFIRPVSKSIGNMFESFGNSAASTGFGNFASTLGTFSALIIGDAYEGTKAFTKALGNLFIAFMPLSTDMSSGLVTLMQRFEAWSSTVGETEGFGKFIAYVRKNGPLVLDTLGQIVKTFIDVGVAIAPMAESMLKGFDSLLKKISAFSEEHPKIISLVAGFAVFSAGLSAISRPAAAATSAVRLLTGGVGTVYKGTKKAFNIGKDFVGGLVNQKKALKTGASRATTFGSAVAQGAKNLARGAKQIAITTFQQGRLALAYVKTNVQIGLQKTRTLAMLAMSKIATAATKAWTLAQRGLNMVMRMNPIGLVITALVLLGAGLVLAYKKSETFRKIVNAAFRGVKSIAKAVFSWLSKTVVNIMDFFKSSWEKIGSFMRNPMNKIKVFLANLFGPGGPIRGAFSKAVDGIGRIWGGLKRLAKAPINFIIKTVYNDGLRNLFNKIPGVPDLPYVQPLNTGGQVRGQRFPYGDKIHALLAPGEEVISNRNGQADKYRQMRDEGAIPRFANGGTVWPAPGPRNRHRSGYGWARWAGDMPNPTGTPVRAYAAGVVSSVRNMMGSYGKHIRVNHGAMRTLYAHLSAALVRTGQQVSAGQMIGRVGSTGNSTGPHLHFEIGGGGGGILPGLLSKIGGGGGGILPGLLSKLGGTFEKVKTMSSKFGDWGSIFEDSVKSMWGGIKKKISSLAGKVKTGFVAGLKNTLRAKGFGFDSGGYADGAGFMPKGPAPERVLSPRQTVAFEDWMRSGSSKSKPVVKNLQDFAQALERTGALRPNQSVAISAGSGSEPNELAAAMLHQFKLMEVGGRYAGSRG